MTEQIDEEAILKRNQELWDEWERLRPGNKATQEWYDFMKANGIMYKNMWQSNYNGDEIPEDYYRLIGYKDWFLHTYEHGKMLNQGIEKLLEQKRNENDDGFEGLLDLINTLEI